MITNENFKEVVYLAGIENIKKQLNKFKNDYCSLEVFIFNTGATAKFKTCQYSTRKEREIANNGNLFCDVDSFLQLCKDKEIEELKDF